MDDQNDLTERRLRRLREMAERGMEKARAVQKQLLEAKVSEISALSLEFEQAARMVRQAIMAEAEIERRRRRAARLAQDRVRSPRPLIPEPGSRTIH